MSGMDTKSLFIPAAGLALLLAVTQSPAQTPAPASTTRQKSASPAK